MYIANAKMNPTAAPAGLSVPGVPATAAEMAIVGFIVIVGLYFGQVVFVPLALAVILSFVLAPAVRLLKRGGLPNTPAVVLVVMFAFALIFGVGALITQQVGNLAQELPRYQFTLKDKVKALRDATSGSGGAFKHASDTLKDLQKQLEAPTKACAAARSVTVTPAARLFQRHISAARKASRSPSRCTRRHRRRSISCKASSASSCTRWRPPAPSLLFVLFLLMQREDVRDRAIRLLGSHDLEKSTAAMDDAGERLSHYFLAHDRHQRRFGIIIGVRPLDDRRAEPGAVGRAGHADAASCRSSARSSRPRCPCCSRPLSIPAGACSCGRSRST